MKLMKKFYIVREHVESKEPDCALVTTKELIEEKVLFETDDILEMGKEVHDNHNVTLNAVGMFELRERLADNKEYVLTRSKTDSLYAINKVEYEWDDEKLTADEVVYLLKAMIIEN